MRCRSGRRNHAPARGAPTCARAGHGRGGGIGSDDAGSQVCGCQRADRAGRVGDRPQRARIEIFHPVFEETACWTGPRGRTWGPGALRGPGPRLTRLPISRRLEAGSARAGAAHLAPGRAFHPSGPNPRPARPAYAITHPSGPREDAPSAGREGQIQLNSHGPGLVRPATGVGLMRSRRRRRLARIGCAACPRDLWIRVASVPPTHCRESPADARSVMMRRTARVWRSTTSLVSRQDAQWALLRS